MANYDVVGNICVVKFDLGATKREKLRVAKEILSEKKSVRTILAKEIGFSGRLRTQKTKFILGEDTKEVLYRENGCVFRFNVDTCYFSPRLSTERKELAGKIKKGERVLVMFGGVAPYAIIIGRWSKAGEIVSVELGRECTKYAKENVKRNKLGNVKVVGGDVRRRVPALSGKFDRIVMARPNLKDSFLDIAFGKIAKGGVIHYHGFYPESEKKDMVEMIKDEARKVRKKIRILVVKKVAGAIGVRRVRFRVDLKVS